MIIIADSGSTKCDWLVVKNSREVQSLASMGLNPLHITKETFETALHETFKGIALQDISHVYFYGAGCGSPDMKDKVIQWLGAYFKRAAVMVESDLLGAVRGLGGFEKCAIGILGTGSHAGLYNGHTLTEVAPSLGYILGDEGGGVWLGKHLLHDYFYRTMPLPLQVEFKNLYNIERADCLDHIYNRQQGASYIAGFSHFAARYRDNLYIRKMLNDGFGQFIKYMLLPLSIQAGLKVHFTGSVAITFQPELNQALQEFDILPGNFVQKPIEGLIYYHTGAR